MQCYLCGATDHKTTDCKWRPKRMSSRIIRMDQGAKSGRPQLVPGETRVHLSLSMTRQHVIDLTRLAGKGKSEYMRKLIEQAVLNEMEGK